MQPQPNNMVMLLQIPIILGIFYFFFIRPERKKEKDHLVMLTNLKKNDEVVTSSGIHGIVVNVKEKTVVLRLDENVRVEFEKSAIVVVSKKAE